MNITSSTSRDETSLRQLNEFAEAARNITRDDSKPSLGSVPGCKAMCMMYSYLYILYTDIIMIYDSYDYAIF